MTRDRFKRKSRALAARLDRTLRYRESSDTLLLVGSALLIGALAGLGVVAFSYIVQLTGTGFGLLRQQLGGLWGAIVAVAIPTLGGLLITPIVIDWAPDVRGSGIPTVMLSVSNFAGRLPKRLILWRPIASAVSLGTGAALGSEGPVVQLSAAIASLTSNLLRLNDERRRNLVAVAAAGGI
ncbi:MAG TPA: chloride channel protein, partial [Trueperaceae bacterium]